jgi:hypothetical protein
MRRARQTAYRLKDRFGLHPDARAFVERARGLSLPCEPHPHHDTVFGVCCPPLPTFPAAAIAALPDDAVAGMRDHYLRLNCTPKKLHEVPALFFASNMQQVERLCGLMHSVLSETGGAAGATVVDVGAGEGYLSTALARLLRCRVRALDSSPVWHRTFVSFSQPADQHCRRPRAKRAHCRRLTEARCEGGAFLPSVSGARSRRDSYDHSAALSRSFFWCRAGLAVFALLTAA